MYRRLTSKRTIRSSCSLVVTAILLSTGWVGVQTRTGSELYAATNVGNLGGTDFARDVYPILRRSCFECHGEEKDEAGLRLDRREDALDSGAIEPGDPDNSELIRRLLLPRGHDEIMPAIGDPLSKKEVAHLRRWIQQGADWPESFEIAKHWAYVAPQRPELPQVSDPSWVRSPIDRFVMRRLDQEGLTPSPAASPEKLARRLSLDLIGLPPSPAEINAFAADTSDRGIEQWVDELMARPQFGERWARLWLDLARYADSHGFQRDNLRDNWAYRDWVINAINEDMPFDQFTIEQVAGDLIPNASESQKIATGFHRCAPTNVEAGSLPEETRSEQIIDRVNTAGSVWLGTTLECCQCHDHKFDPISIKEYYQLLAFFNNTALEADRASKSPSSIKFIGPSMPLSDPEQQERRDSLQHELAEIEKQIKDRRGELETDLRQWSKGLKSELVNVPRSHAMELVDFQSEGSTDSFEQLEDESILLVGGDPPSTDVYKVRMRTDVSGIQAFRLDALRHESLPGTGPGRGDPKRRNFVLTDFVVTVNDESGQAHTLTFREARADFSQKNWDVGEAIDDDPKSGWAISPQFDDEHSATFILDQPLMVDGPTDLTFQMTQSFSGARTIGRFRLSALTGDIDSESVPESILKAANKNPDRWTKVDRRRLLDHCAKYDLASKRLVAKAARLQKQIDAIEPDTTLVMVELDEPRMTSVFERGDYRSPGEVVAPGTPDVLHPMPAGPANRLTLARWLVSAENPLVARVTVNRWWAELFGRGIVPTVEDFGIKGDPPSHPELLDWLAVEFVENGWSIKRLLKTIVLSSTYQQSSRITPELWQRDDLNVLLARGPRFRMDAEMIRDNALSISGLLSLKQAGPPIYPYQPDGLWAKVGGTAYDYEVSPGAEQYRRGIYVVLKRGSPYPSFINFDATPRLACTVKRSRTNTPLQALTLLNDPVYVDAAKSLAERVEKEKRDAPLDEKFDHAFQLCTGRPPTDSERSTLSRLYHRQLGVDDPAQADPQMQADAWYSVATTLMNLHETITKD
tara:strand:- start:13466 stop:16564 length:3099 start_codon:yes stop_codon:yes gene_type:complete